MWSQCNDQPNNDQPNNDQPNKLHVLLHYYVQMFALCMQLSELIQSCQDYSTEASRLQHAEKQSVQDLFDELKDELLHGSQKA